MTKFSVHFFFEVDGRAGAEFPGGGWCGQSRVALGRGSEMCVAIELLVRLGHDLESKFLGEDHEGGIEDYLDENGHPRFPPTK